jgi:aminopeptidase C
MQSDTLLPVELDESHALTESYIEKLHDRFEDNPQNLIIQNVMIKSGGKYVTLNRNLHTRSSAQHNFTHTLKHWNITDQKGSGRYVAPNCNQLIISDVGYLLD